MLSVGTYPLYLNASLAEQKNRFLRNAEAQVSYMKQTSFAYFALLAQLAPPVRSRQHRLMCGFPAGYYPAFSICEANILFID